MNIKKIMHKIRKPFLQQTSVKTKLGMLCIASPCSHSPHEYFLGFSSLKRFEGMSNSKLFYQAVKYERKNERQIYIGYIAAILFHGSYDLFGRQNERNGDIFGCTVSLSLRRLL